LVTGATGYVGSRLVPDRGCRIEMTEIPVKGPLKWLPRRLTLAAAWPRNRESTRRLAAVAERRAQPQ
jgi:hypothetical protein